MTSERFRYEEWRDSAWRYRAYGMTLRGETFYYTTNREGAGLFMVGPGNNSHQILGTSQFQAYSLQDFARKLRRRELAFRERQTPNVEPEKQVFASERLYRRDGQRKR